MRRTTIALGAVTAVSCAISLVLAIGWMNDRAALSSLRAQLAAATRHVAARPSSSGTATATPTAVATSSSACPTAPAPSATAAATTPVYPQIKSVADNFGRVWFPYDSSNIKIGTVLCLTVRAIDPTSRPLQYNFWVGDRPNQQLVCDWGGPTCQWTANLPQGVNYTPYVTKFNVAVRTSESVHRLSNGACFQDDSCDDVTWIQFTLTTT